MTEEQVAQLLTFLGEIADQLGGIYGALNEIAENVDRVVRPDQSSTTNRHFVATFDIGRD